MDYQSKMVASKSTYGLPEEKNLPKNTENDDDTPTSSEVSLPVPPDGGFGWVICVASFICMIILDGVLFSFGVFFLELLDYFQDSKAKTASVGSVLMGMSLLGGPVVSALVNSFGCRVVTISGSLLASGAFIISIFVPSVDMLIVTYGILGGLGFCMMFLPPIIVVGLYFEKRRALANGIAMCGSGIGVFIFAPLCTYLQDKYTWRGGTLVMSALLLNCCVAGALFRPLEASTHRKRKLRRSEILDPEQIETAMTKVLEENSNEKRAQSLQDLYRQRCYSMGNSQIQITVTHPDLDNNVDPDSRLLGHNLKTDPNIYQRQISQSHEHLSQKQKPDKKLLKHLLMKPLYRSDIFYSGSLHNIPEYRKSNGSIKTFISQEMIHMSLSNMTSKDTLNCGPENHVCGDCVPDEAKSSLKLLHWFSSIMGNHVFWLYALSAVLWTTHSTVLTFLAPYAVYQGIPKEKAALLVACAGVANTVGRVIAGALADHPRINCVLLNGVACFIGGIATIILPLSDLFWALALKSTVFGFCMAHWVTLRPIVLVHLLGIANLTNSLGLVAMFQGIAFSLGPPLAGLIFDQTSSYYILFITGGLMFILSGAICLVLFKVSRTVRLEFPELQQEIGVPIKTRDSADLESRKI